MWARAATVAALLILVAFAVYVFRTGDQQQRAVRNSAAWA